MVIINLVLLAFVDWTTPTKIINLMFVAFSIYTFESSHWTTHQNLAILDELDRLKGRKVLSSKFGLDVEDWGEIPEHETEKEARDVQP